MEWIRPNRPQGDLPYRLRAEAALLPWRLRYQVMAKAGSTARRASLLATHLHTDLQIDPTAYLGPGFALRLIDRGALRIAAKAEFRRNFLCEVSPGGNVDIGQRCIFTGMALVQCSTSIRFEDDSIVGQGCLVADGNHRFRDPETPMLRQGYVHRPVTIGPGAVLMSNTVVTNSVGERAVVGANSVVTRPIPPYCLATGNPARVVDYFGPGEPPPELA